MKNTAQWNRRCRVVMPWIGGVESRSCLGASWNAARRLFSPHSQRPTTHARAPTGGRSRPKLEMGSSCIWQCNACFLWLMSAHHDHATIPPNKRGKPKDGSDSTQDFVTLECNSLDWLPREMVFKLENICRSRRRRLDRKDRRTRVSTVQQVGGKRRDQNIH